ncbi:DUF2935 domain-containing protein [Desulforamulus ruminis]|uniref:DUF2935 domain-containing protein n=1 Tax=Desulforamulus ruminis (strain ATCC 23193 / DSM 2154 / NCIMB 8452 / DL) TaxID=696281 RepID=F6DP28_DESRL|nr:DUF2935 domain-containing protein [Desulforamulus ruminis]AEG60747.1 hypothetical protein Desru_2517 [Desulforamulus ruminis DSM 2154]
MNNNALESQIIFEQRFWLQIMGDHSRFIFNALSPSEVQTIRIAQNFINIFDQLLAQARQPLTGAQLNALNQQAYNQTKELRNFKLSLIRRHLVEEIQIHLTPTFINHMVNELDNYLQILECIMENKQPPAFSPVHLHLLWLLDAKGHAFYLSSSLDEVEQILIKRSTGFSKVFEKLYEKSVEIAGYLRTGLDQFPALSRLNLEAECEINLFSNFLQELQHLILTNQALSTLVPLVTDHMLREECYYLTKLALVSEISSPNCDPTKPRIQN